MFLEQKIYNQIKRQFPIVAVELLIINSDNNVLMLKRSNEPAKDSWWIPGGRILFGESKMDAAKRLLKDECGINLLDIKEFTTVDYLVNNSTENYSQHIMSSVYQIKVSGFNIKIDNQSSEYSWRTPSEWLKYVNHDFLINILNQLESCQNSNVISFLNNGSVSNEKKLFIKPYLYSIIKSSMPVPCVDTLILDNAGKILLVKRKNEPAKDKWFVPGGRVLFGEKRIDTAKRKLKEECGLEGEHYKEIGNFEMVVNANNRSYHYLTTVYKLTVTNNHVVLDEQGSDFS